MALINLQSSFDLVQGTLPVGNMDNQPGPQFDLGPNSVLQQDSLLELPTNSPFQDLNGLPDPYYNTVNGDVLNSSPFQSETGDHLIDLLTGNIISSNTNMLYFASPNESTYQDLYGQQPSSFDLGSNSTLHNPDSLVNIPLGQYADLNGQLGPQFDNGPEPQGLNQIDTIAETGLAGLYESAINPQASYAAGQPGGSWPTLNPSALDNIPGTQFDNGPEPSGINQIDTIAETGLAGLYESAINPQASYTGTWPVVSPTILGLGGNGGPPFANNPEPNTDPNVIDSFHESALINLYQSTVNPNSSYGAGQPGGVYPSINPSALDLNGEGTINESTFDNGLASDLHINLLQNNYTSPINPTANYGQGQPGSSWPNINAGGLDLGGTTPTGYTNPETNNSF